MRGSILTPNRKFLGPPGEPPLPVTPCSEASFGRRSAQWPALKQRYQGRFRSSTLRHVLKCEPVSCVSIQQVRRSSVTAPLSAAGSSSVCRIVGVDAPRTFCSEKFLIGFGLPSTNRCTQLFQNPTAEFSERKRTKDPPRLRIACKSEEASTVCPKSSSRGSPNTQRVSGLSGVSTWAVSSWDTSVPTPSVSSAQSLTRRKDLWRPSASQKKRHRTGLLPTASSKRRPSGRVRVSFFARGPSIGTDRNCHRTSLGSKVLLCVSSCASGNMMPLPSRKKSASLKQRVISMSVLQSPRQNRSSQRKCRTNFNETWICQKSCTEGYDDAGGFADCRD